MRKALILSVALVLVCGAVYGTPTTRWIGANSASWDVAGNWDNGIPDASCRVIINNGNHPSVNNANRTIGELIDDLGSARWNIFNGFVLSIVSTSGGSGNFIWRTNDRLMDSGLYGWTLNLDGNFLQTGTGTFNVYGAPNATDVIVLKGTNKAFKYAGSDLVYDITRLDIPGSYWDNGSAFPNTVCTLTTLVRSGGQILARPDAVASKWRSRTFIFEGGQLNLPAYGANVDFVYSCDKTDNVPTNPLVVTSGLIYPRDVTVGSGYFQDPQRTASVFNWTLKGGGLTVGRAFRFQNVNDAYAKGSYWFSTLENGTTTSNNLTVNDCMTIGSHANQPTAGATRNMGSSSTTPSCASAGPSTAGTWTTAAPTS